MISGSSATGGGITALRPRGIVTGSVSRFWKAWDGGFTGYGPRPGLKIPAPRWNGSTARCALPGPRPRNVLGPPPGGKPKTRAPELEKVEPAAARVELAEYQKAKLPPRILAYGFSDESDYGITERVIKVVQVEGPVHREVVLHRLRECYYPARLTGNVKYRIGVLLNDEVRRGNIQESGEFLWVNPDQLDQGPRTLGDRTIEQIPPMELSPVVIDAANALFGSPRSELAKEVARKYGFARTGTKIASAIDASVQQLLDSGQLIEEFGKIRVANQPAAARKE